MKIVRVIENMKELNSLCGNLDKELPSADEMLKIREIEGGVIPLEDFLHAMMLGLIIEPWEMLRFKMLNGSFVEYFTLLIWGVSSVVSTVVLEDENIYIINVKLWCKSEDKKCIYPKVGDEINFKPTMRKNKKELKKNERYIN